MNYNLLKFDQLCKIEPLLINRTISGCYANCTMISYTLQVYLTGSVTDTSSRLQQPVQNLISDNTNVLWNSPSSGKKLQL